MPNRSLDRLRELFAIDIRSLAVVRMGLATMIVVDLLDRGRHIAEFYTDAGIAPRSLIDKIDPVALSYHMLGSSYGFEAALFAAAGVFAVMLFVGYRTRVASVVSWLLLASLQNRNHLVNLGGDAELERVLFWCLFLPLGACWSLDARREGRREPPGTAVCSVASAAVLLQVAFMYLFSGLAKSGPAWTSDFDAIYLALHNDFMVTEWGTWFRQFEGLLGGMTPVVLTFELIAIFFFFSPFATGPLRCLMILAVWSFHFGLASMIRLSTFPFVSAVCVLVYLPRWFWDRLDARRGVPVEPGVRVIETPSKLLQAGIAAGLLYTAVLLTSQVTARFDMPAPLFQMGHALQFNHDWGLYAPEPTPYSMRRQVVAGLADRTGVANLLAEDGGENWRDVQAIHDSERFRTYLKNWVTPRFHDDVSVYGQWLCEQWNADAQGPRAVRWVRWLVFSEEILPGGKRGPEVREELFTHICEA
ncbi:MAG: HTTM domain-containing protein [Myxococcota bacterium]|nr:HTTM domain-containing protein [Myxococcota bacterium]